MNTAVIAQPVWEPGPPRTAASVALWFFIAVVSVLFGLFFVAYVMRLDGADGFPLALPWQFKLSTGLLVAASLALELGARRGGRPWLAAAGAGSLLFVLVQLWAWQVLLNARVLPASHAAAAFLYLLTGLHGLHVLGGLLGWRLAWRDPDSRWRVALCARYWHFLLLLWVGLYATLSLMTPELVRALCGGR